MCMILQCAFFCWDPCPRTHWVAGGTAQAAFSVPKRLQTMNLGSIAWPASITNEPPPFMVRLLYLDNLTTCVC